MGPILERVSVFRRVSPTPYDVQVRITVLAGGFGGSRFIAGVRDAMAPDDELSVIANTADDIWLFGLRVSPDLDTIMYTLGGGIDPERGWGRTDETWHAKEELAAYGEPQAWFGLGDRDLATHLVRTARLREGRTLTEATAELCRRWDIGVTLLPMTDDEVETHIATTVDGRDEVVHFQEYWIRHRAEVPVRGVELHGIEKSRPTPEVLSAIDGADVVLVAPSNPIVSIGPIVAVPGMREALRARQRPRRGRLADHRRSGGPRHGRSAPRRPGHRAAARPEWPVTSVRARTVASSTAGSWTPRTPARSNGSRRRTSRRGAFLSTCATPPRRASSPSTRCPWPPSWAAAHDAHARARRRHRRDRARRRPRGAWSSSTPTLADDDVVVITSKIVSKAAGLAADDKERLVDEQTDRVVATRGGTRIIRTHHGLTLAAAGVDGSNVEPGTYLPLPPDPDASARSIRAGIRRLSGKRVAVVISDTAGTRLAARADGHRDRLRRPPAARTRSPDARTRTETRWSSLRRPWRTRSRPRRSWRPASSAGARS